jgi:hypothetical protein
MRRLSLRGLQFYKFAASWQAEIDYDYKHRSCKTTEAPSLAVSSCEFFKESFERLEISGL